MSDAKPQPAATPATHKGATPQATMGAPLSPTGPNENEDGIIKAPAPEGPGTDQIGLVGGDPSEPLASTPPLEEPAPGRKDNRDAKQHEKRADR